MNKISIHDTYTKKQPDRFLAIQVLAAPAAFMRHMHRVLKDEARFLLLYVDDILVFSLGVPFHSQPQSLIYHGGWVVCCFLIVSVGFCGYRNITTG